jgi:1-phosphatidylinositol phosphodiesterase
MAWIELFYRGADNGLWSRWRSPDGTWSNEQQLGGVLNGNPVAAVVPGTNVMELFYRGSDNSLWTLWRNPDGNWSDHVGRGGVFKGNPSVAAIPGTNVLELFYWGSDNSLWTLWRDAKGNWSDHVRMGGQLKGNPSVAAIPGTNVLELFYWGSDNSLWTLWRDAKGSWSDHVRMGGQLKGNPSVAAIPGTNVLELFYWGSDNNLWTRWRNADGSWPQDVRMGGALTGDPIVAASPPGWMARLPDSAKLSRLTLPGTHESCTAFIEPAASCQNWSLLDQLNHGIRYVDIRCRHAGDVFTIYHNFVEVGLNFGNDVRDVCVNFLKANPTECIVMQIKHEYTDVRNIKTFQQVLDGYLHGFESFFYLDDRIPTLHEVRGKIVVVRRFDLDPPYAPKGLSPDPWQDNATFDVPPFHIQDQYNVPTILPGDINAKWNAVNALLDQAKADASDAWYINFASGSSGGAYPNAVAARINPTLYDYLAASPFANRLGTLMLDFPDDNMIARIITLNMPAVGM